MEIVYLFLTFKKNNIFINIYSPRSNFTFFKSSLGVHKKNSFNSFVQIRKVCRLIKVCLISLKSLRIFVFVKGFNFDRFRFIKELLSSKFRFSFFVFINAQPFNGCRKQKSRRL